MNNESMHAKEKHTISLDKIIGITGQQRYTMAFDQRDGSFIYPAGCYLIQYDTVGNEQKRYFVGMSKRKLNCVCFSSDYQYLIAGEASCKNPEILIWKYDSLMKGQIIPERTLKGHKFGTKILLFSPNNKYLVSIGDENDKGLFVWDFESGQKITQNKLSKCITSAQFSDDSRHLVTVGPCHVKFWDFDPLGNIIRVEAKNKPGAYIIDGKTPILGRQFESKVFTDCSFSNDSKQLYLITQCGVICIIEESTRTLTKWLDLRVRAAYSLISIKDQIITGCSDGIIRVFAQYSLNHIHTFQKPPALGHYNIEKGAEIQENQDKKLQYADCIALNFDFVHKRLASLYSDKTLFIWDLQDYSQASVVNSFINHCDSINDIEILHTPSSQEITFYATTSSDNTVRVWNLIEDNVQINEAVLQAGLRRNIYSQDLNQIIYTADQQDHFKYNIQQQQQQQQQDTVTQIKMSSDGKFLCVGDSQGTLKIYDVSTFNLLKEIRSHEQEITCIDFVPVNDIDINLCATGSRDKQIHIYDQNNHFQHIHTLSDHNVSTLIDLKFVYLQESTKVILVSCSNDKIMIFRELINLPNKHQFNNIQGNQSSFQMFKVIKKDISKLHKFYSLKSNFDNQYIYCGQEKQISVYKSETGEQIKNIETKDMDILTGKLVSYDNVKICLDMTGTYLAIANLQKQLRVVEISNGNTVTLINVGEQITGVKFSYSNQHLLCTTNSGSIYIYKISKDIISNINKKQASLGKMFKQLKNYFQQQEMLQSKKWTIDSFWMDQELKKQFSQGGSTSPMYIDQSSAEGPKSKQIPGNLIKTNNLPAWAKTQQQQPPKRASLKQGIEQDQDQDEKIEKTENQQENKDLEFKLLYSDTKELGIFQRQDSNTSNNQQQNKNIGEDTTEFLEVQTGSLKQQQYQQQVSQQQEENQNAMKNNFFGNAISEEEKKKGEDFNFNQIQNQIKAVEQNMDNIQEWKMKQDSNFQMPTYSIFQSKIDEKNIQQTPQLQNQFSTSEYVPENIDQNLVILDSLDNQEPIKTIESSNVNNKNSNEQGKSEIQTRFQTQPLEKVIEEESHESFQPTKQSTISFQQENSKYYQDMTPPKSRKQQIVVVNSTNQDAFKKNLEPSNASEVISRIVNISSPNQQQYQQQQQQQQQSSLLFQQPAKEREPSPPGAAQNQSILNMNTNPSNVSNMHQNRFLSQNIQQSSYTQVLPVNLDSNKKENENEGEKEEDLDFYKYSIEQSTQVILQELQKFETYRKNIEAMRNEEQKKQLSSVVNSSLSSIESTARKNAFQDEREENTTKDQHSMIPQNTNQSYFQNQSSIQNTSIMTDQVIENNRDLLENYSKMLMQEFRKNLQFKEQEQLQK